MSPSTILQASARRATARRVICSPPPAIITGGRAQAGDLNHWADDRKPDEAVIFPPLRLCLHRLEGLGRIGSVEPGRVVNAELHGQSSFFVIVTAHAAMVTYSRSATIVAATA